MAHEDDLRQKQKWIRQLEDEWKAEPELRQADAVDEAIRARIQIIPFTVSSAKRRKTPNGDGAFCTRQ